MEYYAGLLENPSRIEAFRAGIEAAVRPGDRVLDFGTGLGTYAIFAARAGAARSWGVDRDPIVHVAEEIARTLDVADRLEFIRGEVPGVDLPVNLDVLIFEDFLTPFLDATLYRLLRTLQAENLKPDGRMVPGAMRFALAPVQSELVGRRLYPLDRDGHERYGVDFSGLRPYLANSPVKMTLRPDELRGAAAYGARTPLLPLPGADAFRVEGAWAVDEPGEVDALALWFELELGPDLWVSNEPRERGHEPWGQWILPLESPLPVEPGTDLVASAEFEALPDGAPGFLKWGADWGETGRSGHEFGGRPLGPQDLEGGSGIDANPSAAEL
jgi:SAM-dependent methyltransferase